MKKLFPLIFICATIASCTNEKIQTSELQAAKICFENNATALSLPNIGSVPTKADISSVYPDWENGLVSRTELGDVFEIPLLGSCKFAGVLIEGTVEDKTIVKANVSSYLVIDYRNAGKEPQMFVETIIDKGNRAKTHLLSDKKKNDCVIIFSNLSGEIYNATGYQGEIVLSMKETRKNNNTNPDNAIFGYRLGYKIETKSEDCPFNVWLVCLNCAEVFYANLTDDNVVCPYCKTPYFEVHQEYCPDCGHIWYECICHSPQEEWCDLCGLWKQGCADEGCGCGCQDH